VPGWPSFNLTEAELAVAFIRGLFVAALFSIFGASLFRVLIAPAAMKLARGAATTEIDRHCLLIARWSTLIAALVMLAWLALESGMIADAETVEQALAAIPSVIWNTSFGHILAAQTLALLGTSIALMIDRRWSWFGAVGFAGIAVVLQAGHSHALAMHQEALLLSQCLHLLAAGPWLGGLLPLLLLVRGTPSHGSAVAAQRFSTLGITCVVVLASTAAFQGWVLAGGLSGIVGTAYGWVALSKLALFAMLLAFAALNYLRLVPALARHHARASKLALIGSIAAETGLGLLVVLAAGVLSSLEPGMQAHA
jgi:putative copper resistance protein D